MADIVPLGDDDPARTAALRLVVGGQAGPRVADTRTTPAAGRPADPVSRNLDLLLRTVQAQGLGIDVVLGARRGRHLIGACAAVVSPGRTAMTLLGPCDDDAIEPQIGSREIFGSCGEDG